MLASIRGIAVILDEYRHDHAAAHAAIDQLAGIASVQSHELFDRHASVYFSEGRFAEAEENWRRALDIFGQFQRRSMTGPPASRPALQESPPLASENGARQLIGSPKFLNGFQHLHQLGSLQEP